MRYKKGSIILFCLPYQKYFRVGRITFVISLLFDPSHRSFTVPLVFFALHDSQIFNLLSLFSLFYLHSFFIKCPQYFPFSFFVVSFFTSAFVFCTTCWGSGCVFLFFPRVFIFLGQLFLAHTKNVVGKKSIAQ